MSGVYVLGMFGAATVLVGLVILASFAGGRR